MWHKVGITKKVWKIYMECKILKRLRYQDYPLDTLKISKKDGVKFKVLPKGHVWGFSGDRIVNNIISRIWRKEI